MKYMQNLSLHEYNTEWKFKDLDLLKKKSVPTSNTVDL